MSPDDTPFPTRWWGIDLPGYRECDTTYCAFDYDSLPALPEQDLTGSFDYLTDDPWTKRRGCGYSEDADHEWHAQFETLVDSATARGIQLPKAFLTYVREDMWLKVRFSRGGYYGWPERIEPSPKGENLFLLLFLRDSQDSLLWYLCLDQATGEHCVVSSMDYFGCNFDDEPQTPDEPDNVFFAAPSFEAFIYRTWIENEIWFANKHGRELNERELAYATQYETAS